jgi:ribosome biogenesis GTPase
MVDQWSREEHLASLGDDEYRHVVVEDARSGAMVGYVILSGLRGDSRTVQLLRVVITDKGRGLGREAVRQVKDLAFTEHDAARLWLDVWDHNARARRLYESEGFTVDERPPDASAEPDIEGLVIMSITNEGHEEMRSRDHQVADDNASSRGDAAPSQVGAVAAPQTEALALLGYSPRWEALFAQHDGPDIFPARVIRADRGSVLVASDGDVTRAQPSTALVKAARGAMDLPTVGDWVAVRAPEGLDVPLVEAVLHRSSAITRGDPGEPSVVQILAANVDTVLLVHPIDQEPNLRRIERELSLVWDSGAVPVIVLTKADSSSSPESARAEVEATAIGCDVLVTSALTGEGVGQLAGYLERGRTTVLLGPSGAGKSTLTNALLGEDRQLTSEVRVSDHRGRHTTVTRELIVLPTGGVLIDTPGLRALALTGSESGIAGVFPEIEETAESCHFRDCTHRDEPGCAVRAAVESGELDSARLASYHKLIREAEVAAAKTDVRLRAEETQKLKTISKAIKDYHKHVGKS